ncbi:MAG TPA: hypothetical protein VEA69_06765 [Tepidisphaeraceae bacterium]|nr:hypothetical protein [Tepidisphaeraceae bacterium]
MPRTTTTSSVSVTAEHRRLLACRERREAWKRWGPYVADRAWGTVREDYSADGSAWAFCPHDHARSKAFRWGEDGIAGWCDERQTLCLALTLWNGRDPILKERLFGLAGPEGNHGEDVKELYYHLDATPTHSYGKFLYKYPQAEFPYAKLVAENARRGTFDAEYELVDTGVFNESRYFDVFVEHAKAGPEDVVVRITAHNRGPEAAAIHLLPTLWFRNTWAWRPDGPGEVPVITALAARDDAVGLVADHGVLGRRILYGPPGATPLFTDHETNRERLYGSANTTEHVKDAFDAHVVGGDPHAVSADGRGTKAALWYSAVIPPGGSYEIVLRLTPDEMRKPLAGASKVLAERIAEADAFYAAIGHPAATDEEKRVQRHALAGMLWSKQWYALDVRAWQRGDDPAHPPPEQRHAGRNRDWDTLTVADVISMPDKWEYPWFAAWDLAFHAIPLAMVDVDFAKAQLELLISEKLMHPSGQIPAYEWEFSDVNPPVQAWAVWRVYNIEKHANGEKGDCAFLERCYHKLLLNFTWWVNRKDSRGHNIFQGGFLGLDNISVFDRSQPLPSGGHLEQADATGWMALYALNMMAIGLELAQQDSVYEHLGIKFFEHFMHIASALNQADPDDASAPVSLWDEADGWYYDRVHGVEGADAPRRLKVRSLVGLIPLFAAQILDHSWFERLPNFKARYDWLMDNRPDLATGIMCIWTPDGQRCLLSVAGYDQLRRILARTLDEAEFLAPFGVRSLSKFHQAQPYAISMGGREWTVRYEPAESTTRMFGGNSNWRGPIWFPTAFMLVTALRVFDRFYEQTLKVECPTGSGKLATLNEVAIEIGRRLTALFLPDPKTGRRPCCGDHSLLAEDPAFRDYPLFHEYFHGDTGAGLGAAHQTGWTGLVAKLIEQSAVDRAR